MILDFKNILREHWPKLWVSLHMLRRPKTAEIELSILSRVVPHDLPSVDVGANMGLYTYQLAKLTPVVYAFEPSSEMAAVLRRVAPAHVHVFEHALSDREGTASLRTPIASSGNRLFGLASLEGSSSQSPSYVERTVQLRKLDDVVRSKVGFVKIDVEGHELRVLNGARELINRFRPTFLIECQESNNRGRTRPIV